MATLSFNRRRVWILLAVTVLILGAGATFFVVQKARQRRWQRSQRELGVAAWKEGRHEEAVGKLPRYLRHAPEDNEAWYAFAESRRQSPVDDGSHIDLALRAYSHFLSLEPGHVEALRQSMLLRIGRRQFSEAGDLAGRLLKAMPNDREGLKIKAVASAALARDDAAIQACKDALAAAPLDLDIHVVLLEVYRQLGKKDEALGHARNLLEKHADQGASEVVAGIALTEHDTAGAEAHSTLVGLLRQRYSEAPKGELTGAQWAQFLLMRASERKISDSGQLLHLLTALDRVQRPLTSISVLERAIENGLTAPALRQELVRRLFEAHHFAEMPPRWSGLEIPATGWAVNLVGMKAMVLASMKHPEAGGVIAELAKAAASDKVAAAWHDVVRGGAGQSVTAQEQIASLKAAMEVGRDNPYLLYFLGEAQASIGEPELAIDAIRKAAAQRPFWALAHTRLARLLADRQDGDEARRHVVHALNLTRSAYLLANLASTVAAVVPEGSISRVETVANIVAEIQKALPNEEQTLPLHVTILAQSDRREQAQQALRGALATERPSQGLLLRLAAVSENTKLGLEEECLGLAERLYGKTPQILSARAQRLRRSGLADQGAALLEESIRSGKASREAKLAWAQYLETSRDARAVGAWAMIADDPVFKDDLAVQRSAMEALSVKADRQLLGRTIERVRALTGEKSVAWRMAKARMLASDAAKADAKANDLAEAVKLLEGVIAEAPSQTEPRLMLGAVQERSGNIAKAIEQYQLALSGGGDAEVVRLRLARLYSVNSDLARAREQADQVRADRLDPASRRRLAAVYARLGESARAATLLQGVPEMPDSPADDLLLAEVSWRSGDHARAEQIYKRLLEAPDANIVRAAASFYASTGRKAEAEKLVTSLDSMKLPPGVKEMMLGQYHSTHGRQAEAVGYFQAAVAANPGDAGAWKALLTQQFRIGRFDDAVATATSAAKAHPGDGGLRAFIENAHLLKSHDASSPVGALVLSLIQSADIGATQEALRIVSEGQQQGLSPGVVAAKLRPLADRALRIVPIQILLVHYYMQEKRAEEAAAVVARATKSAPATPELAELSAKTHLAAKDYGGALAAASRWRELIASQPLAADLLMSEIHLRAGDHGAAARQIELYLNEAKRNPDSTPAVLMHRAKIALLSGKVAEAKALLAGPAGSSPRWRMAWIELAESVHANPPRCAEWLKGAEALIPESGAVGERVALASAWAALGEAASDATYRATAVKMLTELAPRAEKAGPVYYALGIIEYQSGNAAAAEAAYRKCLSHDPTHAVAKNNLALLLMERKETLEEALRLAADAVAAAPKLATFYDTLGQVQSRAGRFDAAVATINKAIELEPQNLEWRLSLAGVYADAGQSAQLEKIIGQIETRVQGRNDVGEVRSRILKLKLRGASRTANNG